MKIFYLLMGFVLSFFALLYLLLLIVSKKPFKFFFLNALCGIWCFAVLELVSCYTGLHLPINYATMLTTGILGVPGVALLQIMKYIIFI